MAPADQDSARLPYSERSTDVVAGIVESFLHKQHLQPGELDCLVAGSGDLAGDVMTVSENAMVLLQQVLAGRNGPITDEGDAESEGGRGEQAHFNDGAGSISAMVDELEAEKRGGGGVQHAARRGTTPPRSGPTEDPKAPEPAANHEASKSLAFFYGNRRLQAMAMAMSAPMLLMQLGFSVRQIEKLTHNIVKKCLKGDALQAFETAGKHMQSLRYMSGHLVANGADVVAELADALQVYQKNDFRNFGRDLGRALRKVLLSNNTNGQLPEGLPGKFVMANVTAGVLRGFFGEGFALDLQTKLGYDPVHIDLHRCVGSNLRFFQSLWGTTMYFYAQKESSRGAEGSMETREKKAPFGAVLAVTMMQLPGAVRRCGVGHEEEQMLMDAIKSLGSGLHYKLEMPSGSHAASEDKIANDMATTVKDWAKQEWYTFGLDLGKLLQELFVTVYGQKWSVDSTGTLRKLAGAGIPGGAGAGAGIARLAPVVAAPLLLGLLALRSRRHAVARCYGGRFGDGNSDVDLEAEGAE